MSLPRGGWRDTSRKRDHLLSISRLSRSRFCLIDCGGTLFSLSVFRPPREIPGLSSPLFPPFPFFIANLYPRVVTPLFLFHPSSRIQRYPLYRISFFFSLSLFLSLSLSLSLSFARFFSARNRDIPGFDGSQIALIDFADYAIGRHD